MDGAVADWAMAVVAAASHNDTRHAMAGTWLVRHGIISYPPRNRAVKASITS